MKRTNGIVCAALVAAAMAVGLVQPAFSDPYAEEVRALPLQVTERQFKDAASKCGWKESHVAMNARSVSSINYIEDVAVYSSDDVLLMYVSKEVMTHALISGYLQLANYDRSAKKVTMLDAIPISDKSVMEKKPEPILLGLTRKEFSSEASKLGWNDYILPISDTQVSSVNTYPYVPVVTSDGFSLFYVSRKQYEFIKATGSISLASLPDGKTIKVLGKVTIQ